MNRKVGGPHTKSGHFEEQVNTNADILLSVHLNIFILILTNLMH